MKALPFYKKTANFWQALLRLGIPFVAFYRATDYLLFRLGGDSLARLNYLPWHISVLIDTAVAVIVSATWSAVMRLVFRDLEARARRTE